MAKKIEDLKPIVNIDGLVKFSQAMNAATKTAVEGVVEFSEAAKQLEDLAIKLLAEDEPNDKEV